MNFYYDPILGLQYASLETSYLLDTAVVPDNLSTKEFIKKWDFYANTLGLVFSDPNNCRPILNITQEMI